MPKQCVIFDSGSSMTRLGFTGETAPMVLPTVVGKLRYPHLALQGEDPNRIYVGDEGQQRRGILAPKYPVEFGIVINWEYMEAIWRYAFYSVLAVDPSEHGVIVTEPVLNPVANRERLFEVFFDTFGVKELAVEVRQVLAMKQSGRMTGALFHCGDRVTHCVPIASGFIIPKAIIRVDYGGSFVTDYLSGIVVSRGYSFITAQERQILKNIKESLCYVAMDFDQEFIKLAEAEEDVERSYELPDGQVITFGSERYRAPEMLFQPAFIGMGASGVVDVVYTSIMNINRMENKEGRNINALRNELFANIVLAGGTTLFPGFPERLQADLAKMAPNNAHVNVIALPQRRHSVFIGASQLAVAGKIPFVQNPRKKKAKE